MAEDTKDPQEPAKEPPAKEPEGDPKDDHTGKGDEYAAKKYKEQRDKARGDLKTLQDRIAKLEGEDGEIAGLKKQLEEQRKSAEAEVKAAQLAKLQSTALAQAGCINIDDALKLIGDEDVEDFKESKPYLFKAVQTGSTGGKPKGAAGADTSEAEAASRKAMKLPKKE
jgi:hypothetical protein